MAKHSSVTVCGVPVPPVLPSPHQPQPPVPGHLACAPAGGGGGHSCTELKCFNCIHSRAMKPSNKQKGDDTVIFPCSMSWHSILSMLYYQRWQILWSDRSVISMLPIVKKLACYIVSFFYMTVAWSVCSWKTIIFSINDLPINVKTAKTWHQCSYPS